MIFNELFKKRGFHETLYTLYSAKNYALSLPEFFEKLNQEMGSYYNAFFRVKGEMQKYGIISYKKNREGEKVIGLTAKGVEIMRILKTIDELFSMDFEEYKDKMRKLNKVKSLRHRRATIRAKQTAEEESMVDDQSDSDNDETDNSTKKE
jgi:hypothetical protein